MATFTRVIRSHRKIQPPLVNDDNHAEGLAPSPAASSSAIADRPLAFASPLGLPDERPDLQSSGASSTGRKRRLQHAASKSSSQFRLHQDEAWDALALVEGASAGAGDCTAPVRVSVLIPAPIPPGCDPHFWMAYEDATFQLPLSASQAEKNACAEQAWRECFEEHFGPPDEYAKRMQIEACMPEWCWSNSTFLKVFYASFEGKPYTSDRCPLDALAAALLHAWDVSQEDNGNTAVV